MKVGYWLIGCFLFSASHAATFGKVPIRQTGQEYQVITYEQQGRFAVVDGDIIIGKMARLHAPGAVITVPVGGARWLDGTVPFEIAGNMPFQNRLVILQAMEYWQQYTNIQFVERELNNRTRYHDYIAFIPAEGTTCSSYVGKQGGKQEINLAPRCTMMNTVHELGHALGLWHEQSRADRNNHVQIVWENIDDAYRYNFDQQLRGSSDFGPYDYESIMHYGPYAFSKNGQKTIVPLVEGVAIGQRTHLSEKDIAAINNMYPPVRSDDGA